MKYEIYSLFVLQGADQTPVPLVGEIPKGYFREDAEAKLFPFFLFARSLGSL